MNQNNVYRKGTAKE